MREKMKTQLMDAFNNPSKKNCFYSFNVEKTGSEKLNALNYFDWTPEPSRDVPGNTTCIFPLGLGCPEVYTSDGIIWADPIFDEDEENFVLDVPDVWSGYTGKILNNIKEMAETLPEGELIREPDIQSPLGIAELVCGQGLYIALLEFPDEIKAMLKQIAEFEISFIRAMREVAGDKLNGCCFPLIWNNHEGTLCSDDTLTLVSPAMHKEFSIPYVNMIADAVGPLIYHSCTWMPEHFDNIKAVRNVRAYNWTLGGPTDPRDIIREFSGRGVIAPHLCKDVHNCPETKLWGDFADEAAMLEYILDGMQENTSMQFWFGGYEDHPETAEKLYQVLDERGYTPAAHGY
jgi:hypothetical protein